MKQIYFFYAFLVLACYTASAQFDDGGINYEVVSNITLTAQVGSNNELTGDIVIPETVTDGTNTYTVVAVKGWAFSQGEGATSSISSISLPDTVTSIANDAFANNTLLTTADLGEGVTNIGTGAFYKAGLTSITIPDSVTNIDNVAFFANTSLLTISFGSGLTSIGSQSFAYCNPLTSVSISAATPSTVNVNTFEGLALSSINLFVPSENVSTYSSTTVWEDFIVQVLNINDFDMEVAIKVYPNPVVETVQINLPSSISLRQVEVYNVNGQSVLLSNSNSINISHLAKGQYFMSVETSKGKVVKPLIKL
ncbi:leucine-rich repeat domain-containing protein [Winogradskyella sediminis]|uniref:leucine-rich repeat domain-containing protein n=1 Tax=Winogradskyella sediminis TaxID=1382466 RepID=UPI000E22D39C|nr:leucine-rich repeat domain-containing protein [Winogradskyella sediminis]REG89894.1 putative secreted protein (Por secretion system target) [Winogradskyella sediminis]